jgi:hypothetical protein
VTAKKSYGSSGLAERILVISVTDPRRPSDHIPLERRCAFQWPVLNLRQRRGLKKGRISATLPVQNLYGMKRQPAPAKAKLTIFHRLGRFRKITVFQLRNRERANFPRGSKPGRNKLAMCASLDMNEPNPFLPVIYSSTTLLLVSLALAITML